MRSLFGLAQLEGGTTDNDFAAMLEEGMQDLLEIQDFWPVIDQRKHDHAECRLQLGVFVQIIQHDEGDLSALEFDDDPYALAVRGFVAEIRDALDPIVLNQFRDLF